MESDVRSRALERYAWIGGLLYVVVLVSEGVISVRFKLRQDDSAAKIAHALDDRHTPDTRPLRLCLR